MAGNFGRSRDGARDSGKRGFRLALLCLGIVVSGAAFWMLHLAERGRADAIQARAALRLDLTDTLISARDLRQAAGIYLANPSSEKIGPVSEAEWRLRDRLKALAVRGGGASATVTDFVAELDRLHNLLENVRASQKEVGNDLASGLLGQLGQAGDAVSAAFETELSVRRPPKGLKDVAAAFDKARQIETVFLVTEGSIDPSRYGGELDALVQKLRTARIPAKTEARLAGLVSGYRDAFAAYVSAVLRRSAAARGVEGGLGGLVEDLSKRLSLMRDGPAATRMAGPVKLLPSAVLLAVGLALCALSTFGLGRALAEAGARKVLSDANSDAPPEHAGDVAASVEPGAFAEPVAGPAIDPPAEVQHAEALAEVQKAGEAWKTRNARIESIAQHLEETVSVAIASLKTAAGAMNEAVEAVAVTSKNVLGAADRSGSNHRAVLDALASLEVQRDELAGSLGSIGEMAARTGTVAQAARSRSDGGDAVMERLSGSTGRIEAMLEAIRAVAERTNLLALNATIEAARAGEAGKGFAVVAQEVKQLAAQTAKATQDIEQEIGAIRGASDDAVAAFSQVSGVIDTVDGVASDVRETIAAQEVRIAELSRRLDEAAGLGAEGDKAAAIIRKARGQAAETGAAVDRLAAIMLEEATRVDDEMKTFLTSLRAL